MRALGSNIDRLATIYHPGTRLYLNLTSLFFAYFSADRLVLDWSDDRLVRPRVVKLLANFSNASQTFFLPRRYRRLVPKEDLVTSPRSYPRISSEAGVDP